MNLLTVAYYTALRNFKDLRMLTIMVALPIILIVILGTGLQGFFDPPEIEPVSVAFLNEDLGANGLQVKHFLQQEQVASLIMLVYVGDIEQGLRLVEEGEVESFIYLPQDFSSSPKPIIQVSTALRYPLVMNFLDSYANMVNLHAVAGTFPATEATRFVRETAMATEGVVPRAIDYYAIQTLLQVMLVGGWYGIGSVQDDSRYNTAIRLKAAPIRTVENLGGKILANIGVVAIQATAVVLFSKYVYSANWNGDAFVIVTVLLLFAAVTIALGALIGNLIKENGLALGILWCINMLFSALAGAFEKGSLFSSSATGLKELLTRLSPNYYAKNALFGTIYGGPANLVQSSIVSLAILTAVTFTLATLAGRRRLS